MELVIRKFVLRNSNRAIVILFECWPLQILLHGFHMDNKKFEADWKDLSLLNHSCFFAFDDACFDLHFSMTHNFIFMRSSSKTVAFASPTIIIEDFPCGTSPFRTVNSQLHSFFDHTQILFFDKAFSFSIYSTTVFFATSIYIFPTIISALMFDTRANARVFCNRITYSPKSSDK